MVLAGASPLALYLPLVGRFGGAGGTRDAGVGGFHPTRLTALRALRPPSPSRGGMELVAALQQTCVILFRDSFRVRGLMNSPLL